MKLEIEYPVRADLTYHELDKVLHASLRLRHSRFTVRITQSNWFFGWLVAEPVSTHWVVPVRKLRTQLPLDDSDLLSYRCDLSSVLRLDFVIWALVVTLLFPSPKLMFPAVPLVILYLVL